MADFVVNKNTLSSYNVGVNPLYYTPDPLSSANLPYRNQMNAPYRYIPPVPKRGGGGVIASCNANALQYYQSGVPQDLNNYYSGERIPLGVRQNQYMKDIAPVYPNVATGQVNMMMPFAV